MLANAKIGRDGLLDASEWEKANVETRFSFPWEDRAAPRTEFRALFDEGVVFCAFRVDDDDVVLVEDFRSKDDVAYEDRVEMFFALDEKLAEYFGLEMDPLGRVLDYRASHYRKLDFSWTFPGLKVAGTQTGGGYAVDGMIPLASLKSLGFLRLASLLDPSLASTAPSSGTGRAAVEGWMSWVDPPLKRAGLSSRVVRPIEDDPLRDAGGIEVAGLVAGLPLDVAADARPLLLGDGFSFEHGVEGHHERSSPVTGVFDPGRLESNLAAIDELPVLPKNGKKSGVRRPVGLGRLLPSSYR